MGNELSCVLHGVPDEIINNPELIKTSLIDGLRMENFTILELVEHIFTPQRYSVLALLSESHAAIHTYPEHNSIAFHLYSNRGPSDGNTTLEYLEKTLSPKSIDRGGHQVVVVADTNLKTE